MGFSSCNSWALEHTLNSWGTQALLLQGMRDLPGPDIESVSPALAGRLLTTEPPKKPPPISSSYKDTACDAGDLGSIPG